MLEVGAPIRDENDLEETVFSKGSLFRSVAALSLLALSGCQTTTATPESSLHQLEPVILQHKELGFTVTINPELLNENDILDTVSCNFTIDFEPSQLCDSVHIIFHDKSSHNTSVDVYTEPIDAFIEDATRITDIKVYPNPPRRPISIDPDFINRLVDAARLLADPDKIYLDMVPSD